MLNSTVELISLWALSSPSLLAFCFSHLIIAVLLLGGRGSATALDADGRGDWTSVAARAEPSHGVRVHGVRKSDGGQEDAAAAVDMAASRGRAGEVDAVAVQLRASEKKTGAKGESVVAAGASQERRAGDAVEDELKVRAEEFIRRMNRAWRTENVRLC